MASISAVEVNYTSKANKKIQGVATGYLDSKSEGEVAPIWIRRSQFKLPFRTKFPVVMIGPGTGIAPFIGFLQEREWQKVTKNKEVGRNVLFTGFRKQSEDYLYEQELEDWKAKGILDHLFVAFSRDQAEKVYVQHLIEKEKDLLWELLEEGAYVFVCGDAAHMANDVQNVILRTISEKKYGNPNQLSQANDYLKAMQNKGRYCLDVWS